MYLYEESDDKCEVYCGGGGKEAFSKASQVQGALSEPHHSPLVSSDETQTCMSCYGAVTEQTGGREGIKKTKKTKTKKKPHTRACVFTAAKRRKVRDVTGRRHRIQGSSCSGYLRISRREPLIFLPRSHSIGLGLSHLQCKAERMRREGDGGEGEEEWKAVR